MKRLVSATAATLEWEVICWPEEVMVISPDNVSLRLNHQKVDLRLGNDYYFKTLVMAATRVSPDGYPHPESKFKFRGLNPPLGELIRRKRCWFLIAQDAACARLMCCHTETPGTKYTCMHII